MTNFNLLIKKTHASESYKKVFQLMVGERNPADQKQMKKPVSSWDDLPMDILRTIMEKLFLSERLPLCLVCKTWHESSLQIQNVKEEQFLPWVMTYTPNMCKLRDPSVQASHHIVKGANHLRGASALASRQGWVLFSQILSFGGYPAATIYHYQYFLYNPFTNEVIKFPKLMTNCNRRATFTERPGSPSCMIIDFSKQNSKLNIKTCRPGDKSWKIYEYSCRCDCVVDLACVGDFVYCVFLHRERERLGVFNIKQHKWKEFSGFLPENVGFSHLVVAFNGVLLFPTESRKKWQLKFWRFDLSKEKWVLVPDKWMKEQVIFLCHISSFTVPAVGDAGQSAGMVHSFYPVFDFKCYSFDSTASFGDPEDYRWLNGDYKWPKEDCKQPKIWIQPPLQRIWR